MRVYRINEVAAQLGISKQTPLRYEKRGVFPRSQRNRINRWREYTDDDIKKLQAIIGRGFTLIELIMVLVIIAVLGMLALPTFEMFHGAKLDSAVRKTVADIRYVQELARSRHSRYRMTFNAAANSYDVRDVPGNVLITHPFTRQAFSVNLNSDAQFAGVDIAAANFSGGQVLQFNWNGEPENAANVTLTAAGSVRFKLYDEALTVVVSPGTGFVKVQ